MRITFLTNHLIFFIEYISSRLTTQKVAKIPFSWGVYTTQHNLLADMRHESAQMFM